MTKKRVNLLRNNLRLLFQDREAKNGTTAPSIRSQREDLNFRPPRLYDPGVLHGLTLKQGRSFRLSYVAF